MLLMYSTLNSKPLDVNNGATRVIKSLSHMVTKFKIYNLTYNLNEIELAAERYLVDVAYTFFWW